MTPSMRRVLAVIGNFIRVNQISPTVREAATLLGFSSPRSIIKQADKLVEKGLIVKEDRHERNFKLTGEGWRVLRNG